MSYLQDKFTNGIYGPYYRLESLQVNLKKNIYTNSLREGSVLSDKTFELLENYKNEIIKARDDNLGFNYYASFIALGIYHTFTIYKSKILLCEMGASANSHLNRLGLIGIAGGFAVGYLFGKDLKTYFKYLQAKRYHDKVLNKILVEKNMIKNK
jgi:hypothetical protein